MPWMKATAMGWAIPGLSDGERKRLSDPRGNRGRGGRRIVKESRDGRGDGEPAPGGGGASAALSRELEGAPPRGPGDRSLRGRPSDRGVPRVLSGDRLALRQCARRAEGDRDEAHPRLTRRGPAQLLRHSGA